MASPVVSLICVFGNLCGVYGCVMLERNAVIYYNPAVMQVALAVASQYVIVLYVIELKFQFLAMRILLVICLLFSLPSFAQKDSIEIAAHILPELDSNFRNVEITFLVDYNNGAHAFDIDTSMVYPFNFKLPIEKINDTIIILMRSDLDLGEH